MGGDIIVDKEGNVLFMHRSEYSEDRPSIDQLLDSIPTGFSQKKKTANESGVNQKTLPNVSMNSINSNSSKCCVIL